MGTPYFSLSKETREPGRRDQGGQAAQKLAGLPPDSGRASGMHGSPRSESEPDAHGLPISEAWPWQTAHNRDGNFPSASAMLNGYKTDLYIKPTWPLNRERTPAP